MNVISYDVDEILIKKLLRYKVTMAREEKNIVRNIHCTRKYINESAGVKV